MTFDLPMPPSANHLFATVMAKRAGKGRPVPTRITTREYKAWREVAGEALRSQYARYGAPAVHKPVALHIRLNVNHQSDIANREKAITDLLVEHLDMPDDCWVDRIIIERDRTIDAAVVTVEGSAVPGGFQPFGQIAKRVVDQIADKMGGDV